MFCMPRQINKMIHGALSFELQPSALISPPARHGYAAAIILFPIQIIESRVATNDYFHNPLISHFY